MFAFEAGPLWGGIGTYNKSTTPQHIDAYIKWTDNVENYQAGSSIIFWQYMPDLDDIVILAAYEDTLGEERPAGFDNFLSIPSISETFRIDSHRGFTAELESGAGY